MNKCILAAIFLLLIGLPASAMIKAGEKAPSFILTDGNDSILNSRSLQGRAIVGFYNSREASQKNILFEIELNKFYTQRNQQANDMYKLAATDGTPANSATRWIWKRKIRQLSQKRGIIIYGDWNGAMKKAYRFPEHESIFIIIDKSGVIRYIHAGLIPVSEYARIKNIIRQILK